MKVTAERDLAGIELALKSSTVLVDVGLRRHERGEGYLRTILLSSSSGQILKRVALQSKAADVQGVRRALHQRVVELLGGTSVSTGNDLYRP